jgi:hypothetical protein
MPKTTVSNAIDRASPADGRLLVRPDWLTVAAVAVVVNVITTLIHEGLGHGGACILLGGKPLLLTSMQFQGDKQMLSSVAVRMISAAGPAANLVAAMVTIPFLRRSEGAPGSGWFFLWLFATVNLLVAAGYPLYSGMGNIGDFAVVVAGFEPAWLWRILLIVFGGSAYWLAARWAMHRLGQHLSVPTEERVAEANRYTLVAFALGGVLSMAAGLFEPGGIVLLIISGAAASLGGTSALAWGPQLLHDPSLGTPIGAPLHVKRQWSWIVVAAVVAIAFVVLLGPGISFREAGP